MKKEPLFRRPASRPKRAGGGGGVRAFVRERPFLAWGLGAVVLCFAVGYLVTWVLFFPGFGRSAIVTVPDLTGMPRAAAERTLGRLGLEVERGDAIPNPRIAEGRVLMQVPLPGEEVPRGSTVRIVPSAGPELRTVPAVRGLSRTEAVGLLERYGFRVEVGEAEDRSAAGTVLGVRPSPGEPAAVGSTVALTVSSGPPWVAVPAITGAGEADARARLDAAGLTLGRLSYAPESEAPTGTVVAQTPAAGDSLRMGSAVRATLAGEDPTPPEPPAPEPQLIDLDGDGVPDVAVEPGQAPVPP